MLGRYKCVLLVKDNEAVICADQGEFHSEVMGNVKMKNPHLKDFRCAGGGRIVNDGKTLRVYGYSVDFGTMDKDKVEELLSDYCINEGLNLINEVGNGY